MSAKLYFVNFEDFFYEKEDANHIEKVIGLTENETYFFDISPLLMMGNVSIKSSSKNIGVNIENNYAIIKTGSCGPLTIITLETSSTKSYCSVLVSIPKKEAQRIANIANITELKNLSLEPNIINTDEKFAVEKSFQPSELTLEEKQRLSDRTGWTVTQINKYSNKEQCDYFQRHCGERRTRLSGDKAVFTLTLLEEDLQNIQFANQPGKKTNFENYFSGIKTNYVVLTQSIQISAVIYNTKITPFQYSDIFERFRNIKIHYLIKHNVDFDLYGLTKDILNDNKLSLIVETDTTKSYTNWNNLLNVYWNKIDEAVSYTVEVYKSWNGFDYAPNKQIYRKDNYITLPNVKNQIVYDKVNNELLYVSNNWCAVLSNVRLISAEIIDKDFCYYYKVDSLASGEYLVRVIAKNRKGEILAKSNTKIITTIGINRYTVS